MKSTSKIILALSFTATAAAIVFLLSRIKTKRMLHQISDEGYETAHDILFPGKSIKSKGLQYGPVIPS